VDRVVLERLAPLMQAADSIDRKRLLAATPGRPLPESVIRRAKTGFSTPVSEWQRRLPQFRKLPQDRPQDAGRWSRGWSRVVAASLAARGDWVA
jgi:asparagine synthase (glutamine-hydrolysing)